MFHPQPGLNLKFVKDKAEGEKMKAIAQELDPFISQSILYLDF